MAEERPLDVHLNHLLLGHLTGARARASGVAVLGAILASFVNESCEQAHVQDGCL